MRFTIRYWLPGLIIAILVPLTALGEESGSEGGFSLGTSFSYQGELKQHGTAAEGIFDFEFELYGQANDGALLGSIIRMDHPVEAGVFKAHLDFGQSIAEGGMWLEIHVRTAGNGPFTVLTPRQLLAKTTVEVCTVDSDLVVTGNVGIGIPPINKLTVTGGTDTDLGFSSGYLGIGSVLSGRNIGIDGNEIQARYKPGLTLPAEPAKLHLNYNGGEVYVGGPLNFGLELAYMDATDTVPFEFSRSCPSGKVAISGGCGCPSGWVTGSYQPSATDWACVVNSHDTSTFCFMHVLCANAIIADSLP